MDEFRPEPIVVPFGTRGVVNQKRYGGEDGKLLTEAHDFEGKTGWYPVEDLERVAIPESWLGLNWFVVAVTAKPVAPGQPTNEQIAAAELMALSLPVILPVEVSLKKARCANGRPKRGKVPVASPLFKGYVLVGLTAGDCAEMPLRQAAITRCRHVAGMLGTRADCDRPVAFSRSGFRRFAELYNEGWFDERVRELIRADGLKVGSMVEITEGPFAEFTGFVMRVKKKSESGKAMICKAFVGLNMLGAKREVEYDVDSLRVLD